MKIGIYPGTFDPVTSGHLNIIKRSLQLVDKLYIAISADSAKNSLFSLQERQEMIIEELQDSNISRDLAEVTIFSGLMIDHAREKGAIISIRGVRNASDFEYEFQMSCMNKILDSSLQTVLLPATTQLQLVSSKLVKEVIRLGGDVGDFLSDKVKAKLVARYRL
jgi:pantetheine-phosphate adenylyltransferase